MRENTQQPVPAKYDPAGLLAVHSIFPTIQGEGPFCGERALFVRLNGCNLRCPGCDTEYTEQISHMTPEQLLTQAMADAPGDLIVLTGGEPFRQNVSPAIHLLLNAGFRIQVETNGVLCAPGLPWDNPNFAVVCSPKTSRIDETIYECATAFKYVVQAGDVHILDGLPLRALGHTANPHVARPRAGARVYIQPMDEQDDERNALNLEAAILSAMDHNLILQIQVHKIINLP